MGFRRLLTSTAAILSASLLSLQASADSDPSSVQYVADFTFHTSIPQEGIAQAVVFAGEPAVQVANGSREQVKIVDALSGQELRTFKTGALVLRFSADGQALLSIAFEQTGNPGDGRSIVKIWDVATGLESKALSIDGRRISASDGRFSFKLSGLSLAAAFSPNGRLLAIGSSWGVHLFEVLSGREVRSLRVGSVGFSALAFSPDGRTVAVENADGTVRMWDVAGTGSSRLLVGGAASESAACLCPISFSADGRWLAAGADEAGIRLWDLHAGPATRPVRFEQSRGVQALAFAPDSRSIASGGEDGSVGFWEVPTGRKIRRVLLTTTDRPEVGSTSAGHKLVRIVAFSPDGRWFAAGTATTLELWFRTGDNTEPEAGAVRPAAPGSSATSSAGPGADNSPPKAITQDRPQPNTKAENVPPIPQAAIAALDAQASKGSWIAYKSGPYEAPSVNEALNDRFVVLNEMRDSDMPQFRMGPPNSSGQRVVLPDLRLYVFNSTAAPIGLAVFQSSGRAVASQKIEPGQGWSGDVEELPKGIYYLGVRRRMWIAFARVELSSRADFVVMEPADALKAPEPK